MSPPLTHFHAFMTCQPSAPYTKNKIPIFIHMYKPLVSKFQNVIGLTSDPCCAVTFLCYIRQQKLNLNFLQLRYIIDRNGLCKHNPLQANLMGWLNVAQSYSCEYSDNTILYRWINKFKFVLFYLIHANLIRCV